MEYVKNNSRKYRCIFPHKRMNSNCSLESVAPPSRFNIRAIFLFAGDKYENTSCAVASLQQSLSTVR